MNLDDDEEISADDIRSQYVSRDVMYAIGDQDNATAAPDPPIPNDPQDAADLDVTCPAEWQGDSRYSRSLIFKSYMDHEFQTHSHQQIVVQGVAHQLKMYNSANIQRWMFN